MTDEETNMDDPITDEPVIDEPTVEDNPIDETLITGKYCNSTDIEPLFGDISDDINTDLFTTVLGNTEAWIESNLKRHYVPIPTTIPQALKTVAVYHGASDILLSLYHGEDLPVQFDVWFNKAQDLLDDYINEYLNADATLEEQVANQMVKHSHSLTYKEKRRNHRWGTSRIL